MEVTEQNQVAGQYHYMEEDESDAQDSDSDDSEEDPTFDVVEETRSSFSTLSIKKKSKSPIIRETEESDEEVSDVVELVVPELNEEDQKSFEFVQTIIEGGQVEKLKVDQCKVYLRKHGLRLTGNKDTLIGRIKEHLDILKGGGEKKYPIWSFVLNCKGDACTGDVVMFEQNVYEMYNIASRSASGPPCGTRIVAGRIVKESYGAAKQQHTFTIEVLWNKGEKPLPLLHPLLIKGRNLYRLKTMRQRWKDEGERQKILSEKHARGSLARSSRETRIQLKEMRKTLKGNRTLRVEDQNIKKKKTEGQSFQSLCIGSQKLGSQPQQQQKNMQGHQEQKMQQKEGLHYKTCKENTTVLLETLPRQPGYFPNVNLPLEKIHHQMQHSTNMPSRSSFQRQNHDQRIQSIPSQSSLRRPLASLNYSTQPEYYAPHPYQSCYSSMSPLQSHNHEQGIKIPWRNPFQRQGLEQKHTHQENTNFSPTKGQFQRHGPQQRQLCRFYAQGRCYYGDQCKYLHEYQNYGPPKG
ncbi:Zinc finger CCCH domain-containing protein [Actinidia chinensis var. chinensis]|uniref:Zinc finger CCCH domain-containing protein n=1 Tax=Actinidia chinensis var. chinensis TaxID=1590841 RepID=A0A2R6QFG8_ACTCC|nr:Zinc finger CCCH domain-containing protein [Actinidia chinensis var. chinensis]